jgi:NAD(P)H-dependent flavin oxidoreductase YrpB (nitropropane dioxygenase family)
MNTPICDILGVEVPIFAFSHCRDVVLAVSKAGGMGVLGITYNTPEELEADLAWIDARIDGRPYGVDVLIPSKYEKSVPLKTTPEDLPRQQVEFMRRVLDEAGIPRLPEDGGREMLEARLARVHMTPEHNKELLDVALRHPIKAVVNALGAPPVDVVRDLRARGIRIGGLVGKVEHVAAHKAAGVDFIVAQGMEAAGHTGQVTSMVLWPQVVDAAAPIPVLGAGGVGGGRQMAAALALGCDGVWCGSIWLGTRESEVPPDVKSKFWPARAEDAIQTRMRSGKPARLLRSALSDAWQRPDAPPVCPLPMQTMVMCEPHMRIERGRNMDFKYYAIGQIVGSMTGENTVRQVVQDMLGEFADSASRLQALLEAE